MVGENIRVASEVTNAGVAEAVSPGARSGLFVLIAVSPSYNVFDVWRIRDQEMVPELLKETKLRYKRGDAESQRAYFATEPFAVPRQ